jgi:hypothetical protein
MSKPTALTGLSTTIKPQTQSDFWIVYLPKGDRAVDQNTEDGMPIKLRVNPSALSAKRMEAARRLAAAKPNANQPYTDYNHDDKEASGRPLKFTWHDDLGVIGLTRRTLQAVERTTGDPPEFQAFSPHVPIDPETGEAVGIYMNCGGFVNRPLFGDATSLSAAAHLPQELVAADSNEVELVGTEVESRPFTQLVAKLCAHHQLDASTVTEPELIAAFEKTITSQPAELTAKAAPQKPSDEEIGMELVGFAVGCGILAPAERTEWERRLAKDRAGWTKELLAKAPSVLLGRVIQDQSAGEAAGGAKPKAKWEHRVEELCAKDPLIAPIAARDPARAKSIALERIAREEPVLLK